MQRWLACSLLLASLVGCSDGKRRAAPEPAVVWAPVWRQAPSLLRPVADGIAAVEANGFIYVIGGGEFYNTTEYAQIQPDGSLSPWRAGPPMNERRGFLDAVVHKGYIYAAGGGRGTNGEILLRTVERAKINDDGSLAPWQMEEHGMVSPRRCNKMVVVGDSVVAVGGFGGDMLNTVEHAEFVEGGGTDEWLEEQERMTVMRYISGVKHVGSITYVVGGHAQETGAGIKDVEWSKVIDEAGYGPWQQTAPLNIERFGLALAYHDDRLYAFGGISGAFTNTIESARILPDGGVEPWQVLETKLAAPRAMQEVIVYKDWVYMIGGAGTNVVEYATFDDDGRIGSWVTRAELAAVERQRQQAAAQNQLPLSGRVLEAKAAAPYIYLQVELSPGRVEWLAGPEGDYRVGDVVRFPNGALVNDFVSKQLGMQFEQVRFVDQLQKAQ